YIFLAYVHHRVLHSFPTRRSSDLPLVWDGRKMVGPRGIAKAGIRHGHDRTTAEYCTTVANAGQESIFANPSTASSSLDFRVGGPDRKSTRLNSSHLVISYAVFCLK